MAPGIKILALVCIGLVVSKMDILAQTLPAGRVPATSRQTIAAEHPGARVQWTPGQQNGYEGRFLDSLGVRRIYVFDSKGQVFTRKEHVLVSKLPAPVTKAMQEKFPGIQVNAAWLASSTVVRTHYEIEATGEGKEYKLKYATDGRMLSAGQRPADAALTAN